METVTPRTSASDFRIHQKPPLPSTTLNKKRIIAVVSALVVAIAIVMLWSLSPREKAKEDEASRTSFSPSPNETVQGLPNDYEKFLEEKERIEVVEASKDEKATAEPPPSVEDKLLEEARIRRLKNQLAARDSELSFKGVSWEGSSQFGSNRVTNSQSGATSVPNQIVAPATVGSARDDDNRQDDKNTFLENGTSSGDVLKNRIKMPVSKYQLAAGTVIPGVLLTGLNSDLPGQILGQVSQDVYDSASGKYLLIAKGSKVVGQYDSRIVYGQERALIVWTRIIFSSGKSINLEKMPGVDMSGYAGATDIVNNHYGRLLMGVVMTSLLGAGAQMAQGPNYQTINPDFDQLALQGAASQINQTGQQITRKNLNVQPTIEIRPGHRFNVFVTKDVVLEKVEE